MIRVLETGPFDWLHLLCPLEEARRLIEVNGTLSDSNTNWEAVELDTLVQRWQDLNLGPLREPPRVLILPREAGYEIVLLCKVDNNGTCYWLSNSVVAHHIISQLMNSV